MTEQNGLFRRNATRLLAVALIAALYGFARLPTLPEPQRQALASRFAFTRTPLATPVGANLDRTIRQVHPDYQRHRRVDLQRRRRRGPE